MRVTVRGLAKAQDRIKAMAARARDMRPIMAEGAAAIVTLIDDSFRQQRAPDGTPWEPLQPETLRRRRGGPAGAKILIDTGRLRASNFAVSAPKSIKFGTNTRYAAPHQLGGEHLPARPFLPVARVGGRWMLMASGPAGTVFARIRERLRAFIVNGTR